jgi:RNA polymerase sigma-70 factor (ECF subfamily)
MDEAGIRGRRSTRRGPVGSGGGPAHGADHTIDSAGSHDGELIKAVAEGDADALAVLYDRHGTVVFSLCLRMLRDADDAEELLEDVFWQLWRRADQFDPTRGSAVAYLLTLTRSRAIDRLRTRERRVRLRSELPDPLLGESLLGASTLAGSPLQEALALERRARVRVALADLPALQREAVELSFLEGLSHPEISTRLGEPLGTIKTRIRNGLLRMRDSLRDATGGTGR